MARSAVTGRLARTPGLLRRGELGPLEVAAFTASATTPMTVVFAVMTMAYAVTGFRALPLAFVVIGAVLVGFCVGFAAMARHLAYPGAFYTYISHGLGRPVGVGAAWVALFSYSFLQVGLYGGIGAAADPVLRGWFGVAVPWWVVAGVAWAIVTWMGLQRVKVSARVLVVLLAAEIGVILLCVVTGLINPAGGSIAFDALNPAALTEPGFGASLTIAVLGFIGFEAAVVYVEEARDPHRTVRNASYGVVIGATAVYMFGSWAHSVIAGPDEVVAQSQEQGLELLFGFVGSHLGPVVLDVSRVVFVTSMVLAMISFHNTIARYMYALGRERVLPRGLADTRPTTGAPKWGSIVQSTFAAVVIMIFAFGGWDPVTWLFYAGGTSGAIGVLVLLAVTSIAILCHFVRRPSGETMWHRIVAPCVASLGLAGIAVLALADVDVLLGVAADSWLRWGVPSLFLLVAVCGVLFAVYLRHFRPDVYRNIGLAAKSSTATTRGTRSATRASAVPASPDIERDR